MQCEIFDSERKVGILHAERQGLYTRFYGEVSTQDVTKVFAVFEGGECPLGVPVPEHGKMVLRASMPTSRLPKGKLLRGRLPEQGTGWQRFSGGVLGGVRYPAGLKRGATLRFPWKVGDKLPAEEVMLLYSYREEQGKSYLEITLREDGTPVCDGLPHQ